MITYFSGQPFILLPATLVQILKRHMISYNVSPPMTSQSKSTLLPFLGTSLTSVISFVFLTITTRSTSQVSVYPDTSHWTFPQKCPVSLTLPALAHFPYLSFSIHSPLIWSTCGYQDSISQTHWTYHTPVMSAPVSLRWPWHTYCVGKRICGHGEIWLALYLLENYLLLNQYFPNLLDHRTSFCQGTHITTPQIQCLQKYTVVDNSL